MLHRGLLLILHLFPLVQAFVVSIRHFYFTPTPSIEGRSRYSAIWNRAKGAEWDLVPVSCFKELKVKGGRHPGPPLQDVTVVNLTPELQGLVESFGVVSGTLTVATQHTTTAITINEWENRLVDDLKSWLLQLAPPDRRSPKGAADGPVYRHNDLDQRPECNDEKQRCLDNGWDISDPAVLKAWRAQEPINCHAHLLAMLLGSSETVPISDGRMVLGLWQSILLVDLDGPRDRTVGVQIQGLRVNST